MITGGVSGKGGGGEGGGGANTIFGGGVPCRRDFGWQATHRKNGRWSRRIRIRRLREEEEEGRIAMQNYRHCQSGGKVVISEDSDECFYSGFVWVCLSPWTDSLCHYQG